MKQSAQDDQLKTQLHSERTEVAELRKEKVQLERYLREQEATVQQTMSEWGAALNEFKDENDILAAEKRELLADKIRLREEIIKMRQEAKDLETKILRLDDLYKKKVDKYSAHLVSLKSPTTEY